MGESGVGKELFSNELHKLSARVQGPFVPINCAAIPETLVESELFGVEKGAFTGAVQSRAGYFERAHGGTLFLDEIASLTYSAQGKVLRAVQERKIERVGGTKTIPVDVRVVAASNVDLAEEVRAGRFRQDLYFRLCVFPIAIRRSRPARRYSPARSALPETVPRPASPRRCGLHPTGNWTRFSLTSSPAISANSRTSSSAV